MTSKFITTIFGSILLTGALASTASAGGLLTDIGQAVGVINNDQAQQLDDIHANVKKLVPEYGRLEEDTTNRTRESLGLEPHCIAGYSVNLGRFCSAADYK